MSSTSGPIPDLAAMVQTAALAIQRAPPGLTPQQLETLAGRAVVARWRTLGTEALDTVLSRASLAVFGAEALNAGEWGRYDAVASSLGTGESGSVWITAYATFLNEQQSQGRVGPPTRVRTIQVQVPAFMAGELVADVIRRIKDRWEKESGGGEIEVEVVSVIG